MSLVPLPGECLRLWFLGPLLSISKMRKMLDISVCSYASFAFLLRYLALAHVMLTSSRSYVKSYELFESLACREPCECSH